MNKAKTEYSLAIDLDGLRFRAPSQFNKIINNLSSEYKIPVANVDDIFRENASDSIIGSQLLVDHVHPNITGYFLLAKAWYQTLQKNNLIGINKTSEETDSVVWKLSSVTQLDSVIGDIKIQELKSRPPFSKTDSKFEYTPHNPIEEFANQYVIEQKLSWAEAHLNLAKAYFTGGDYKSALKEFRAILVSDDSNPMVLKLAGDICLQLNDYRNAEMYYSKANKFNPNQFIEYKLAKTELFLNKPNLAIRFFNSALERNKVAKEKFKPNELEDLYYNLAGAYNKINEPEKANEVLRKLFK